MSIQPSRPCGFRELWVGGQSGGSPSRACGIRELRVGCRPGRQPPMCLWTPRAVGGWPAGRHPLVCLRIQPGARCPAGTPKLLPGLHTTRTCVAGFAASKRRREHTSVCTRTQASWNGREHTLVCAGIQASWTRRREQTSVCACEPG